MREHTFLPLKQNPLPLSRNGDGSDSSSEKERETDRRGFKEALYRIWCGANRLGNSGVHTIGDNSGFVNPAGQLLLTRRGKTRMDGVGIVFEFYTGPL